MLQYPNNIYDYVLSSFFSGGGRVGKVVSRVKGEARISTPASKRKNEREKERMEEEVNERMNEWTSEWMRERYAWSQLTYCKQRSPQKRYKITFLNWARSYRDCLSQLLLFVPKYLAYRKWTRSIGGVNSSLYFQFRLFYVRINGRTLHTVVVLSNTCAILF